MKRSLVVTVVGVLAFASQTAPSGAVERSLDIGIKGRVLDTTCYGPCVIGDKPKPFAGEAEVVVRRLPTRKEVARVGVVEGRFRVGLDPGRYRVRVRPYPDQAKQGFICWEGSAQKARVKPGEITRVRLTVTNVCVV